MARFLIVCTANICRSPLAEGILRMALNARGVGAEHEVDSAGIQALVGQAPAPHSIAVAAAYGADIRAHVAREFCTDDFLRFDEIIAMDYGHLDFLQSVRPPNDPGRIALLPTANGHGALEIGDPYGGPRPDYERAGRLIATGIATLLTRLLGAANPARD